MKRRDLLKSAVLVSGTAYLPKLTAAPAIAPTQDPDRSKETRPELSVALLSDLHIDNNEGLEKFIVALKNIHNKNLDNIIIPGDLADTKQNIENVFKAIKSAKVKNAIITLGNHDVRGPDRDKWVIDPEVDNPYYNGVVNRYRKLNGDLAQHNDQNLCFRHTINGYDFISLNTDRGLKDVSYFEKSTLAWLVDTLDECSRDNDNKGKPIFINVHQSLDETHWRAELYGGFGFQCNEIKEILAKYPQCVVITGHIHNGFGVLEVIQRTYGTFIEVPSFLRTENGLIEQGYGYIMDVYKDAIVFKAFNFVTSEHYPEYDLRVELPSLSCLRSTSKNITLAGYADGVDHMLTITYPWKKIYASYGDEVVRSSEYYGIRRIGSQYVWQKINSLVKSSRG